MSVLTDTRTSQESKENETNFLAMQSLTGITKTGKEQEVYCELGGKNLEEIYLTTGQIPGLIAVLIPLLIYLITKPVMVDVEVPEIVEQSEEQPAQNLRYLQIKTYYGG